MQRFQVLVWPDEEAAWEGMDRVADTRAEGQVEQIVERWLELSPEDPFHARFSAVAQERFREWRRELEQQIRSGELEPHLAKSRSLLPKLALIFHLTEAGAEEAIPLVAAERAAQYCAYLESHARRVYGSVASPAVRWAAKLGERLRTGRFGKPVQRSGCVLARLGGTGDGGERPSLSAVNIREAPENGKPVARIWRRERKVGNRDWRGFRNGRCERVC
jgi:putative DNA primase/helicase